MRPFRPVPAAYTDVLDARIRDAIEYIHQDVWRRANGEAPLIPDPWISPDKTGDLVVIMGAFDDSLVGAIEQARADTAKARRAVNE